MGQSETAENAGQMTFSSTADTCRTATISTPTNRDRAHPGRRLPPTVRTATLTRMARPEMHADEIHTDAELIHRLMIAQFPQ
jgi:hypothetical protein